MSETSTGASTHKAQPASAQSWNGVPPSRSRPGWMGWILFAATMMLMLGIFHAIQGLVALFQDEYYLVGKSGLTVHVDYTTWGWVHLILGILVAGAGAGLLGRTDVGADRRRPRVPGELRRQHRVPRGVPLWSLIMIAVDVLVIWAMTVHGSRDEGQPGLTGR